MEYEKSKPEELKQFKPEVTEEMKKKFQELKTKLDKFKNKVLKEFGKDIIGISLLPPRNIEKEKIEVKEAEGRELSKEEIDKIKKQINLLVLTNDPKDKKEYFNYKKNLVDKIRKFSEEIDKNLNSRIMLISELKENCFDAKYEILSLIALSAIIHDPHDMLAGIKVAEVHKNMVLKKFERYIVSYVAAGSLFRGEKSYDIDVYIIVDDTDVKKMSRFELKEKLRAIIVSMGFEASDITGVKKQFHVQTYILTDFWESVKDAHPVIFTFLRDGIPLFDRGTFMPWRLLLQMGRIRPSMEAIDMQMDVGEKLLDRAKKALLGMTAEDIYYSVLNPSQAALMLYGVNPPTPKETIKLMDEIFVKKEKLLEPKYVKILENTERLRKQIEHGKVKEIKGTEVDKLMKNAELYLKRIQKLFASIEKRRESESIVAIHDTCIKLVKDILKSANVKTANVEKAFKEKFIDTGEFPEKFLIILKEIIKGKKDYKSKKLTKVEAEKIKRDARILINLLFEYIQRKRGIELERAKIRFKYGDKFGEALLLDDIVFIIKDIDAKEKEISKARLTKEGSLSEIKKSTLAEMEKVITEKKILPKKVFIKEKIFEDLRLLFGKDIEILINY